MVQQLRLRERAVEAKGVVYTKPWVVDLILDLVGYRADRDLASLVAVEPAAGEGAFLVPMVRRLLESLRRTGRPLTDAKGALLAYELNAEAAAWARQLVISELTASGVSATTAARTAKGWVIEGDYLLTPAAGAGADLVVGNPPYIRYDDLPAELYALYRAACPTMVGRCDVYVGFIEAGLRQLKPGGHLGFICADRWMRSAYGSELRRFVADNASVEVVIEMHNADAFKDAVAAYPAVTVLRHSPQGSPVVGTVDAWATLTPQLAAQSDLTLADSVIALADKRIPTVPGIKAARLAGWYGGDVPWPWAEPEILDLIRRLEADHRPLEDESTGTRIGIGVATGADQVFITTDAEAAEPDRLLPLAMAADTRDGTVAWSGHYLVDPWSTDGRLVDLGDYPRLAAYFDAHRDGLVKRHIAGRQPERWYRTIDRVLHSLHGREKLYFPDMKLQAHPVLDRGETYPHHNLYYVVSDVWDLEVLGGLLLSEIAEMFVASYCVKMQGGTLRFQAQYLRRIRVPDPGSIAKTVQQDLRGAFRRRDRAAATQAARAAYRIDGPSVR
jgi:hypothetical protein